MSGTNPVPDNTCLIINGKIEFYKGKLKIVSEDNSECVGFCDGQ